MISAPNGDRNAHETVNIVATAPADPSHEIEECVQLTAAQATPTTKIVIPTVSTIKGLRTIYINGYSAPD